MQNDLNRTVKSFAVPGFVSESRPEVQIVRSLAHRSAQPLYVARYRHDKPNLGLLEPTPLADQVSVAVEMRPFQPIHVFCDGRHKRKPASRAGALALYDLRRSWCADIRDPFDNLNVYIPLRSFHEFAGEHGKTFLDVRYDVEQPIYDEVMLHLMQAIAPALEKPHEASTLFLDSLFLAIRDHIAVTYGIFRSQTSRKEWGLSAMQLRRALEFIESNLGEDVSLANIAGACGTSVSSLVRGFASSLRMSPHRWVLHRRIAMAQNLIYRDAMPLSEVAILCGFADQSHLSRVFARRVGTSPAAWRRKIQR